MIAANLLMARALAPIDQMVSVWRSFIVDPRGVPPAGTTAGANIPSAIPT